MNLYFTDSTNKKFDTTQYDCFRVVTFIEKSQSNEQIMLYCITQLVFEPTILENDYSFSKYTFADLSTHKITSQQLYQWSASIDLIEDYQNYLNQLSYSNTSPLAMNIFYNCTLPRFGTTCQYEFDDYHSNYKSIQEIIRDYYQSIDSTTATDISCYTHLKCDRGPLPSCLDWSEICDGRIDCSNDAIDEEHCWQLEINECQANEFRCINGQCIPKSFHGDTTYIPDCLDQSDEYGSITLPQNDVFEQEPSFRHDDVTCYEAYLTSTCTHQRVELLLNALFSVQDKSVTDDCWFAIKNLTHMPSLKQTICFDDNEDERMIKSTCPNMIYIPSVPVLFHNIYFAYTTADLQMKDLQKLLLPYTCYNDSRYDRLFTNYSRIIFKNSICYRSDINLPTKAYPCFRYSWLKDYVRPALIALKKQYLFVNYNSMLCNRSSMYQCRNSSKCISIHRLMDTIEDCPYNDDENKAQINNKNAMKIIIKNRMTTKDLPELLDEIIEFNLQNDIFVWGEISPANIKSIRNHILFQTVCDGYRDLMPIVIDGQNHTDETECELWSCDNIYTSCNGYWNCPNGEDEFNCPSNLTFNCSLGDLQCISMDTKDLICLSGSRINDGIIDCVGANDEPYVCYRNDKDNNFNNFYCLENNSACCLTKYAICDGIARCDDSIDEYFCEQNRSLPTYTSICDDEHQKQGSKIEQFLCETFSFYQRDSFLHFELNKSNKMELKSTHLTRQRRSAYCHRGFAAKTICFCPPSFYGDRCQYQNQRISLTIQFRTSSNLWQIPFAIIISLIDDTDQRLIHSYEQLTYLPVRDCQTKFHLYLLYSTRPKNTSKQYAIHIDIYEKTTLSYRASLLIAIQFPFLPVHRLAFIIDIPATNETLIGCSSSENQCIHGTCMKYSNDMHHINSPTFCQCESGWSGRFCTIPSSCTCSSDSLCLGVTHNNQSICICPLHKFGPRCFLVSRIYSTCQNDGVYIPHIELPDNYTCICPTGYKGKHCEIIENKIMISFEKDLIVPQTIFIHFLRLSEFERPHQRMTNFQTIPYKQESIVIYWTQPFHLMFIGFSKENYYLTVTHNGTGDPLPSIINTKIHHSDRCQHINEIFNKTFVEMHLIRRIKYYHLPCRMLSLNLSCFYDDIHICLCQTHRQQRTANCFEFHHNMKFDCQGRSVCENDAHCFQDSPTCPRQSICVCRPCFYGTRCQFSTTAFSLSIEAVLGYHIQPHVNLSQQPSIVQFSMLLSIILILVGFINSICAMLTFRQQSLCQVGCGIYLFTVSVTTLLTTIIFGLKFWLLIQIQRGIITNRVFLMIQCYSIDFLFSCCLKMDQWLTTCIAIERATITIKSVRFNKRKSRQSAKLVILIIILFIVATNIHDPIHRQIINEKNEFNQRIWCIASYSSFFTAYNYGMNTFHFIAPFLLNILSVFILFTKKSHQQTSIESHRSYNSIFLQNIHEHKHLLIAPIVSITLSLPRIIISFIFKCMKSTNDSWLYLFGYFISLVPYLIVFIIFVLPSKFYLSEYRRTIREYRNRLSRYAWTFSFRFTNLTNNTVHPT